ncbi:glycosyltransferase family 39 protein [Saccharibacillus sp. CPCC 101409]|uniref:ArnT family glycosyltransferase n=1 Tax=Saccharibacillus sp. CPCC 101409 TaxID=3058041 RepID=UPI0026718290|nr:glycosyltransferase family 39 protein [Saccharibacillus sp. CPCC 101409]MDO3412007.1 glycosyltransferase family 39 protein [Saccharibacillus sp. CPCC 101409]
MFSLKEETRRTRLRLLMLCALVFLVSCAISLSYGDRLLLGSYAGMNDDDVKYVQTADKLLETGVLTYNTGDAPSTFIMPLFPLLLAGARWLGGEHGAMLLRIVQGAFQALGVYLMFVLAKRALGGTRAAMTASVLLALYLPDYWLSGSVLTESTFRLCLMLTVCLLLHALDKPGVLRWALFAVCWTSLCYFKPHAALLPLIPGLFWLARRYSFGRMLAYTAVILSVFALLMSPWWIRNYEVFGRFIPFTEAAGSPMILGAVAFGQVPDGFYDKYPQYGGDVMSGSDDDMAKAAVRMAIYGFTHEPLKYLAFYTAGKFGGLYGIAYWERPILGMTWAHYFIVHAAYLLLGIYGIVLALKRKRRSAYAPLAVLAYFTLIYVPFIAIPRYGYPNMFLFILFAAPALLEWYERWRSKRRQILLKKVQSVREP